MKTKKNLFNKVSRFVYGKLALYLLWKNTTIRLRLTFDEFKYRRRITKFNTAPTFNEKIRIISSPPRIDSVWPKINTNKRLKFICKIVSVLKPGSSGPCHVSQTTTISLLLSEYVFPSHFISFQWKYHQYYAIFFHTIKSNANICGAYQCVREECVVLVNTVRVAFYLSINAHNKYYCKQYMSLGSRWHFICAFEIYIKKLCKYFNKRFKIQRNFLFILFVANSKWF